MRFVLPAGGGVTVDIDGQAQGTVEGADFAHALLSIWSGPRTPDASLKAGLLGSRWG